MYKSHLRWIFLGILCLVATLLVPGEGLSVRAASSTPAEMLQKAWQNAREAGSYHLLSDVNQTLTPRSVPEMIGQQEVILNLTSDGAVILPDQAYLEMRMADAQSSSSVVILRDTRGTFLLQDGKLKPVENTLNLADQSNDPLGYLAAADQVTLLDPPDGQPSLVRYGFIIDGPRYAEYIRQQAEAAMKAEPGAPEGLTVQPAPVLQALTGQGELWVNQAGLPMRLMLDLVLPEINAQYGATIAMTANFSSYGEVISLPKAVQGADGAWQLQGSLPAEAPSALDAENELGSQSAGVAFSSAANSASDCELVGKTGFHAAAAGQPERADPLCGCPPECVDHPLLPPQSPAMLSDDRAADHPNFHLDANITIHRSGSLCGASGGGSPRGVSEHP